jgi:hypothetical protein
MMLKTIFYIVKVGIFCIYLKNISALSPPNSRLEKFNFRKRNCTMILIVNCKVHNVIFTFRAMSRERLKRETKKVNKFMPGQKGSTDFFLFYYLGSGKFSVPLYFSSSEMSILKDDDKISLKAGDITEILYQKEKKLCCGIVVVKLNVPISIVRQYR